MQQRNQELRKRAIEMIVIGGQSTAEVAEAMSRTTATIRRWMREDTDYRDKCREARMHAMATCRVLSLLDRST